MIHHIALYKLKPEVTPDIRSSRRRFATQRCWHWNGLESTLRLVRFIRRSPVCDMSISRGCVPPFTTHRPKKFSESGKKLRKRRADGQASLLVGMSKNTGGK